MMMVQCMANTRLLVSRGQTAILQGAIVSISALIFTGAYSSAP